MQETTAEAPYYDADRYRGVAPISERFVRFDLLKSSSSAARAEADDDAAERGEPAAKRPRNDDGKRSRGQNKAKDRASNAQIARDPVNLCIRTARGQQCDKEGCRNGHDLVAYLAAKPKDLDTGPPILDDAGHFDADATTSTARECPLFAVQGVCAYGYKCRFLDTHVDRLAAGEGFQGSGLSLRGDYSDPTKLEAKGELNVVLGAAQRGFRSGRMEHTLPASHAYLKEIGATQDDVHAQGGRGRGRGRGGRGRGRGRGGSNGVERTAEAMEADDAPTEPTARDNEATPVTAESAVTSEPVDNPQSAVNKDHEMHDGPPDVPNSALEKRRLDFRDKLYLAPLTTVGNLPFRRLCGFYGSDIHCGEMGLASEYLAGSPSEWSLVRRHPSERTFGVQVCGARPHHLVPAAEAIVKTASAIDFVDVNCGCPIDLIVNKGAGSALLEHAGKLGKSLVGMSRVLGDIPLTIKLRTGVRDKQNVAHKLVTRLREWNVSGVTLHGRTRQQRYSKQADYDYIRQCVNALRAATEDDDLPRIPFVGNGDAYDYRTYYENLQSTDVDTIMIARGALVKPHLFTEIKERRDWDISASERLDGIGKLASYGMEHWGTDTAGLSTTRRFLCEALSFQHRYIPVGLLERLPAKLNDRPLPYSGRNELETLLSSPAASDWDRLASMFLGPPPADWKFTPKHKSNAYEANG